MDHKTFGKIVATLRKEQVNFRSGHGWKQQDLADHAGLTSRIVGRIERGSQARLDAETLQALADSFDLTSLERREFFAMACEVMDNKIVRRDACGEDVFRDVWKLLEELCVPAFITDPFGNLIGANRCIMAFHGLDLETLQVVKVKYKSINNLALILDSNTPMRQVLGHSWHEIALANLQQWRATTLRYRHTSRFREIMSSLSTCPEFGVLWAEHNSQERAIDDCSRLRRCVYTHGLHGPVGYTVFTSTSLTENGDLYLSSSVPQTMFTTNLFQELANKNKGAVPLSSWPDPSLVMSE